MSNSNGIQHGAIAQLYRWYQIYELPEFAQHLDILASDVVIHSAAGLIEGREALSDKVKEFAGWKNAHHVKKYEVIENGPIEIALTADIEYQCVQPSGQTGAYSVHYEAKLIKGENGKLPVFTYIKLQPTGILEDTAFVSAYETNRAKSFLHHWFHLLTKTGGKSEKFKELLSSRFSIDFGTGAKVSNETEFASLIEMMGARLKTTPFALSEIKVGTQNNEQIDLDFILNWGELKGDPTHLVKQRHTWVLDRNSNKSFAALKSANVDRQLS